MPQKYLTIGVLIFQELHRKISLKSTNNRASSFIDLIIHSYNKITISLHEFSMHKDNFCMHVQILAYQITALGEV